MKHCIKYMVVLISALLLTGDVFAQRIIYNAQEAISGNKSNDILDVQVMTFATKLAVIKKDGTKEKFDYSTNKIWGYENQKREIYRLYKGEFYLVKNISGPVPVYITQSTDLLRRGVVKKDNYFFSKSLDSGIHDFSKRELMKAYKDDSCFFAKIARLKQGVFIERTIHNTEVINSLYKECH